MRRDHKWMTAASIVAAVAVAFTGHWFSGQLVKPDHPGELAYVPEGVPPLVDLRSVQREWPSGLGTPGGRNRLIAYLHDIEGDVPRAVVSDTAAKPDPVLDLGTLLAGADASAGKSKMQLCMSCHSFDQGGRDGIGPNLWGIVGRTIAARPDFAYSSAMAAQQGSWTHERLFDYLASPARALPGTKMSFAGLRRPEDRAAVIKYLATLGGNPPPMPQPATGGG